MSGKITAIESSAEGLPLTVYVDGRPALRVPPDIVEKLGLVVGMPLSEAGLPLRGDSAEGEDRGACPEGSGGARSGAGRREGDAGGRDSEAGVREGGASKHESGAGARESDARPEEERERAKAAALRLLAVRARSVSELKDRLARKGFRAEVVADTVRDLESVGLVDDGQFARMWCDERVRLRPMGPRRLRSELRRKGVPPAVIDRALERTYAEHDETELALRALRKRAPQGELTGSDRRRLQSFLARRGFGYDAIADAFRRLDSESRDAPTEF